MKRTPCVEFESEGNAGDTAREECTGFGGLRHSDVGREDVIHLI